MTKEVGFSDVPRYSTEPAPRNGKGNGDWVAVDVIPRGKGCGRGSDRDFARFLQIAMGSASELEYHLILARDLGLLDDVQQGALEQATTEVKRMLTGFMKRLKAEG